MKKILAIGAFERDNFGDLLFLVLLKKILKNRAHVIPASVIFSDMRSVFGEIIYPYDLLLKNYQWDAVWVVGGEIGGVDVDSALSMGIGGFFDNPNYYNEENRKLLLRALGAPDEHDVLAYVPTFKRYHKNKKQSMVINSVGIHYLDSASSKIQKNATAIFKESQLSVRDIKSSKFCDENDIKHLLAPDVIHLISKYFPKHSFKPPKQKHFIFQANADLLRDVSYAKLSKILFQISDKLNAKIILLPAGLAHHHDSITIYEDIILSYKNTVNKSNVSIFNERDPIKITECIAMSTLCIGTSLHCRIVSESYNVPRVSLKNQKTAEYAEYWDKEYPYDIEIGDLEKSIENVVGVKMDKELRKSELMKLADSNIDILINSVLQSNSAVENDFQTSSADILCQIVYNNQETLINLVQKYNDMQKSQDDLQKRQVELTEKLQYEEAKFEAIQNSKTFKIGRVVTAPYRIINRKK